MSEYGRKGIRSEGSYEYGLTGNVRYVKPRRYVESQGEVSGGSSMKLTPEAKFEMDAMRIADEMVKLLSRKQADYGPLNIASAPGGPLNGLRVRLFDKVQRLSNLVDTGAKPENESLEDTFKDIANYGIIGLMVLRGLWPTLEGDNK